MTFEAFLKRGLVHIQVLGHRIHIAHVNHLCGKFCPAVACVLLVAKYISLMNPDLQLRLLDAFSDLELLSPA